ncbi:hypothetical protein [Pontibacter actiniarum]|uniref:Uncharacterized protein n=1 Tax=Pontibacter actiniarum TaxID=323450 RepID=A0A1X9YP99_9BACT|nr:hypothetical protein [Pontibacter actiniarum]ARS34695.1 hypothetical protein CA264_04150 [Pontibacter actiniarum]
MHPSLVSSADGELEQVLFTIPAYVVRGKGNPLWKAITHLLRQLPDYTDYTAIYILAHESVEGPWQQWLEQQGLMPRKTLQTLPDAPGRGRGDGLG